MRTTELDLNQNIDIFAITRIYRLPECDGVILTIHRASTVWQGGDRSGPIGVANSPDNLGVVRGGGPGEGSRASRDRTTDSADVSCSPHGGQPGRGAGGGGVRGEGSRGVQGQDD